MRVPDIAKIARLRFALWHLVVCVPKLRILAWRYDRVGSAGGNRVTTFTRVERAVCSDAAEVFVVWDLVEKIRSHRCITDPAGRHLDGPYLECFFIDPNVYLAPEAAFLACCLKPETSCIADVPRTRSVTGYLRFKFKAGCFEGRHVCAHSIRLHPQL